MNRARELRHGTPVSELLSPPNKSAPLSRSFSSGLLALLRGPPHPHGPTPAPASAHMPYTPQCPCCQGLIAGAGEADATSSTLKLDFAPPKNEAKAGVGASIAWALGD